MSQPIQDPAVVLVAALIAEDRATKAKLQLAEAQLRAVTWERDELIVKTGRMDIDLIEAGGIIQTLEDRLAEAYRRLDERDAAADSIGPTTGTVD